VTFFLSTYLLLLASILSGGVTALAQEGGTAMPLLTNADLPGWTVTDSARYSGKELYGYIDGGAELYHEYGFMQLATQVTRCASRELRIEVYRMQSAESAFGIFSLSRGTCPQDSTLAMWSCVSGRQILCSSGPFALSVIGDDSTKETAGAMDRVMRVLLARIPEAGHRLPPVFASAVVLAFRSEVQFLSGPLALQQARPEWEPYFDGIDRYAMHTLVWESNHQWYSAGLIRVHDGEDRLRFLRNAGFSGRNISQAWTQVSTGATLRGVRSTPSGELLYCETDGGNPGFRPVLEALTP
jgi:hypothetical protein